MSQPNNNKYSRNSFTSIFRALCFYYVKEKHPEVYERLNKKAHSLCGVTPKKDQMAKRLKEALGE